MKHAFLILSLYTFLNASHVLAESVGSSLNNAQSQFPTIYLPSVGEVDRRRFELPEENPNAPKLRFDTFEFSGVNSIDVDDLQQAFTPFKGRDFTPKQLLELTDLIVDTYREHDIAAVARIPPQDAKNGNLLFEIHESKFAGVVIDHGFEDQFNVSLDRVEALAALPLSENSVLKLSERERQQLLTIDMHGISVSGGLQANDDGDQELELWVENSARVSGTIDLNNSGLSETGSEQVVLTSMLSSPFQRGGASYFNAIKSSHLNYASLAYRGPIGLRGTTVDLQLGSVLAATNRAKQRGTSYSLGLRHPLVRTLGSNLFLSGIAEQRALKEAPSNPLRLSADYQVNTLRVTLDGNRAFKPDRLTYRLQTTLGKTDLSGSPNRSDDRANANTQGTFNRFSGFITYRNPLPDNWQLLTHLQGQMSHRNLDDSQRMIAGGAKGLRGFNTDELIVDQGAVIRVDVTKQLNDQWRIGGFFDWAHLEKRAKNRNSSGALLETNNRLTLYNWGLATHFSFKESVRVDFSLAQALSNEESLTTQPGDVNALINLEWEF